MYIFMRYNLFEARGLDWVFELKINLRKRLKNDEINSDLLKE
jgi:hypothetical protein